MIAPAVAPTLLRLSAGTAVPMLAAVTAACLLPAPYAAVPDHLRRGAWSLDTILVPSVLALRMAFALPLACLIAVLPRCGHPVGGLLAIPLLIKVAVLGVLVFAGTVYSGAFFAGLFMPFDLAIHTLMGFGPSALIWPFWWGLDMAGPHL